MTKEEAINTWLPIIKMGVEKMPECKEALDIAIKALEREPCEDAVSRQAVLVAMRNNYRDGGRDIDGDYVEGNYSEKLYDAIISLPPVTPQMKIGKWKREEFPNFTSWFCDKCGRGWRHRFNYCPNCGDPKVAESEE